ncbi:MAG: L-2-amino-thiazoline-4-carboxylic acid hydrolase [Acetatifactor sp.]|nr:L-2-amino-thiazoline-4-carboxylic acid hydrolase [Acetatifactor sp.]
MTSNIDQELKKKTSKTMKSKEMFLEELKQRMSPAEAEKIWRDAHKRLYKAYVEHMDLPKGVRSHTDSFIFPAGAIYLAMKEKDEAMAFEVMEKKMAEKSKKMGAGLAKMCKHAWFRKFFLGMWDTMSHKMFGDTCGFQNVFYPKEKGCFRMDVTACPYNKYLTEMGCPEINILFCKNDEYTYGNLPGLKFSRTKTIGAGNGLCDFKMELKK